MNTTRFLLGMGAAAVLTGCAGPSLRYDFDGQKDFSQYKTYDWDAPRTPPVNPFMDARVRGAVERELSAKAFRKEAGGAPDFLVLASTVYHAERGHGAFNVGVGMGFLGVGTTVGSNHRSMVASIVLEVEDFRTRQLVWKCTKDDVLDDQESPADADADVAKAVAQMLGKFPPQAKR